MLQGFDAQRLGWRLTFESAETGRSCTINPDGDAPCVIYLTRVGALSPDQKSKQLRGQATASAALRLAKFLHQASAATARPKF